jgi:hypothetical protein
MEELRDELRSSEEEGMELLGSRVDYQQFLASNVWKDLQREWEHWKQDIFNQLGVTGSITVIRKLQGNLQALERVLMWPAYVWEQLIEREKEIRDGRS